MQTMETVTISEEYQIVIPQKVHEAAALRSGEKLKILASDGRIELIPVKPMKSFRGITAGINTEFDRNEDRV